MSVTPESILSLPLTNLQTLLANSATFQTWVGAIDANEALGSIHLVAVDVAGLTRPFALIDHGEEFTSRLSSGGAGQTFITGGTLDLLFEAKVSVINQGSYRDAKLEFTNQVGKVLSDMMNLSGSSGYLSVHSINQVEAPARSTEEEEVTDDDFYSIKFQVTWGI